MGEIQIKKPQLGRAKTNRIRHPAAFCVSVHRLLGHIPKRQFLKKIPVSKLGGAVAITVKSPRMRSNIFLTRPCASPPTMLKSN